MRKKKINMILEAFGLAIEEASIETSLTQNK